MARQGHYAELDDAYKREAGWVSLILSAQIGKAVTPGQLLGTEKADEAEDRAKAEKAASKLAKRTRGRRIDEGVTYVQTPFGG